MMCAVRALNSCNVISALSCPSRHFPQSPDLAKVHRLDTLATKSRANRWAGTCLTSADNDLDNLLNTTSRGPCLGHCSVWSRLGLEKAVVAGEDLRGRGKVSGA